MDNTHLFQTNRELAYSIEQETLQLETLKSHLKLNNDKSIHAYNMLGNFDERLSKLETSILPIHSITQKLKKFNENVDTTIVSLTSTIEHMDIASEKESLLLAGPKNDLEGYFKAIEEMRIAKNYLEKGKLKSTAKTLNQINQVLKAVLQHLLQAFKNSLSEQSQLLELGEVSIIPKEKIKSLLEIIKCSKKVEQELGLKSTNNLEKTLIELRSKYMLDLFNNHVKKCHPNNRDPIVQGSTYIKGSCKFIQYTKDIIAIFKIEEKNINKLISEDANKVYGQVIEACLNKYIETGELIVGFSKKDLHNEIFLLYDILETLLFYQQQLISIYNKGKLSEQRLLDLIKSISVTLMKSLPAFLDDIRNGIKNQGTLSHDGTVHEMASSALNFIKRLLEYPNTVESNLNSLGKNHSCVKTEDNLDYINLSMRYFSNVLDALLMYIDVKSKGYKNVTLRAIFVINNLFYLSKSLTNNELDKYIHNNKLSNMERNMKKAMDQYHESWKVCFECLTDTNLTRINLNSNNLSSSERSNIKDKFKNFNQALEDIIKQHKAYSISDPELKQKLIEQILKVLLPIYTRNLERFINTDFSKNPSKYIIYNKDSLASLVNNLF